MSWIDWTATGTQVQELGADGLAPEEISENEEALLEASREMAFYDQERRTHDARSYMCDEAGGADCLALGHLQPSEDGEWPDDDAWHEAHPMGWDGDPVCKEARYGDACTACESDDCPYNLGRIELIWSLPGVEGRNRDR